MVGNDTAVAGINTGRHGRSVYHRRTGINRMMIAKSDSFAGKLPKRGSCFLVDEIRAHSVPHNDDDMPVVESWCVRGKRNDAQRKNEDEDRNRCAIFREHDRSQTTQIARNW